MNATANTATDSDTTAARSPQRPPAHGRLLVALFGSACACATLPACDDPGDPAAVEALVADMTAEDAADDAEAVRLSLPPDDAEGFTAMGIKATTCTVGQTCAAPPSPDWCTTYGILADSAAIPKVYRDIMASKCAKNVNDACYECWDLANYCSQVGTNCGGLRDRCTCMARKLGQI